MTKFVKGQKDRIECVARVEYEDDEGNQNVDEFILYFKEIGTRAQAQMQKLGEDSEDSIEKAFELLQEHIVDWKDVLNPQGKQIKFTQENLIKLLDVPAYFQASLNAMISQESPEKN